MNPVQKKGPLLFLFFACLCCSAQRVSVYFKTAGAAVSDSAVQSLKAFAATYNNCHYRFRIEGFSDGIGKEEANQKLSLLRAEAVSLVLQNLGLSQPAETTGYGEKEAAAAADSGANPRYRRVDVIAEPRFCEEPPQGDVADLYRLLRDKGQEFCINPDRDTALVGHNGTIVYYKPGTFQNTAGCTCLRLVLHEFYNKSDLILNNLTTTSNDLVLESGGMTKLEGFCGGDTLRYGAGKFLTVMMPTDTVLPGMKLLSANRSDVSQILNWQLDKDFPGLDSADWQGLKMYCLCKSCPVGKCPFFFCRIRNFFSGISLARWKQRKIDKIFKAETDLMNKYSFKEELLGAALERSKAVNKDLLKYYVYKNASWDYHNIDRYKSGGTFVDFTVEEKPARTTDVKLVYLRSKSVVPSFEKSGGYRFRKTFDNESIYVIGLKYVAGQPYLSLAKDNTSAGKGKLNFKPVTTDELKTVLQRIN